MSLVANEICRIKFPGAWGTTGADRMAVLVFDFAAEKTTGPMRTATLAILRQDSNSRSLLARSLLRKLCMDEIKHETFSRL
jgi:hypothetical protein